MQERISILIVDDEADHAAIFSDILSLEGYTPAICSGGREALEHLRRSPCDLVLTDLAMPRMDGLELLRQVRSQWPQTQVIVITSFGDVRSAVKAMQQGAFSYFTKGDAPEELLHEVAKVQRSFGRARQPETAPSGPGSAVENMQTLRDMRQEAERQHIEKALQLAHGNKTHAARALGITYRQLLNRLKSLGI